MAVSVKDSNFKEEVLSSKTPVLVDFYADWCGPCKMLSPVIEELAKEYTGRVKVVKLNVDEASGTAAKFGIMSIPTLLFFKDGKVVNQIVGAASKRELKDTVEACLKL